jgi:hypothetical protein
MDEFSGRMDRKVGESSFCTEAEPVSFQLVEMIPLQRLV